MEKYNPINSESMIIKQNSNDNLTEITDPAVAKMALLESRQLYADLVSNQSAGIYRILFQKPGNGKSILESVSIEFVSGRFLELMEIDSSDFLLKN